MAVPPSLHRGVISKYAALDPLSRAPTADPEIDGLATAVDSLRTAAEEVEGLKAAVSADRSRTPADNALRLRTGATTIATRAAARLDEAAARAATEIARVTAATFSPPGPRDAAEIAMHAELRGVLRNMPAAKRVEAVAGNNGLTAAVLSADPLLSGLSAVQHDALRYSWRRKHYPAELERLERLAKAVTAAERSGGIFVNFVRQSTDTEAARIAATTAARAAESLAAAQQKGSTS